MSGAQLYRHFDKDNVLLYVGVSLSAVHRLSQHKDKPWFKDIRRVDVEPFDDRNEAFRAESEAVAREAPLYNVRLQNKKPVRVSPVPAPAPVQSPNVKDDTQACYSLYQCLGPKEIEELTGEPFPTILKQVRVYYNFPSGRKGKASYLRISVQEVYRWLILNKPSLIPEEGLTV